MVAEKLMYGAITPHLEYHTVMGAAYDERKAAKPRSEIKAMLGPSAKARRAAMGLD